MYLEPQRVGYDKNSLHMGIKPQKMGKKRENLGCILKKTCLLRRKNTFFFTPTPPCRFFFSRTSTRRGKLRFFEVKAGVLNAPFLKPVLIAGRC